MNAIQIIAKKRDGFSLTESEISFMVKKFVDGDIPDYQMAAFLMAAYLRGLDREETFFLTKCMVSSGKVIDFSPWGINPVDKHSTGGVGDKTTMILLPLVGACGVEVCKMSGRALGHTGGTVDKLESIPGFRTDLSLEEMISQVKRVGIALSAASKEIAPADKKIYALRDATATVDNLSFIASSVMSKKIAGGAKRIVLDVKVGKGAFMKEIDSATSLAQTMIHIGERFGLEVSAFLTSMEEPLGFAVGNSLEVKEAIEFLKGDAPLDLMEVCFALASEMLILAGICERLEEAQSRLQKAIDSGEALNLMRKWIEAQGGRGEVVEDYSLLPRAKKILLLRADREGYIQAIDALKVGQAAHSLGAGRLKKEESIDHGVGIVCLKKVGDRVRENEPIMEVHFSDERKLEVAIDLLREAVFIEEDEVRKRPLVLKVLRSESAHTH